MSDGKLQFESDSSQSDFPPPPSPPPNNGLRIAPSHGSLRVESNTELSSLSSKTPEPWEIYLLVHNDRALPVDVALLIAEYKKTSDHSLSDLVSFIYPQHDLG